MSTRLVERSGRATACPYIVQTFLIFSSGAETDDLIKDPVLESSNMLEYMQYLTRGTVRLTYFSHFQNTIGLILTQREMINLEA